MTLKRTADVLTAIRLLGALVIPVIGLIQGPTAVAGAGGWLLLLLWLTDLFDGNLARRSGHAGEGFFGRNDGWVDLALAVASFTMLAITGFVNPWVYGATVIVIVVLVRVDFLTFQSLFTFAAIVLYFVIAVGQDPTYLAGIALLGGLHALFSRERFVVLWHRFWEHVFKR
jgi:phosphatidylglycerophosphate synthase